MDREDLIKMYGLLERIDERTETLVTNQNDHEKRLKKVEANQVKTGAYSTVGAAVLSFLVQRFFIYFVVALSLTPTASCGDQHVQGRRHQSTSTFIQSSSGDSVEGDASSRVSNLSEGYTSDYPRSTSER